MIQFISPRRVGTLSGAAGILAALCLWNEPASAVPKDFVPDVTFTGSTLAGWHPLGQADWSADNGEIIAKPSQTNGGWLVLDRGYQDVQLYAEFRTGTEGKGGILLRAEKTADGGLQGVFVPVGGSDSGVYNVVINSSGQEISRSRMAPGASDQLSRMATASKKDDKEKVPGFARLANEVSTNSAGGRGGRGGGGFGGRGGRGGGAGAQPGDWNITEIILDCDELKVGGDGRLGNRGSTSDRMMGYGPIALYAGGSGEVRFKDVAYKDLNAHYEPKEIVSTNFTMQRINDFYYGWSAAAADINHDGIMDVVAGPFYYLGPDYTERHEFTASRTYNPSDEFCEGMIVFAWDFTGDGWPDILMVDQRPIYLYVNPRGETRRWDRYKVVDPANSEMELLKDIEGDGKREVLYAGEGNAMCYAKPDPADPTKPWIVTRVSGDDSRGSIHGMGVGDINGDGRNDIVAPSGWWEQPPKGTPPGPWKFHPQNFGSGGAEMGVFDVNGDGLNDVVTAINAHGFGLAWFEQKRDAQGNISFVRHDIMGDYSTKNAGNVTFAELHAAAYADIDGDGIPDIIVGKRLYSHLESYTDPDPMGPAVLYWYRTVRNPSAPGGAEFVPELIHNRSGVGSGLDVVDLNHDGAMDIITSVNKGTFIFWGKPHAPK